MKIKGLVDEDFLQYKKPSMFVITSDCSFKCEQEANCPGMCQNSELVRAQTKSIDDSYIVQRFLDNDISEAIVFGGLEPFDQWEELLQLIVCFREKTDADIVIYTGYKQEEICSYLAQLRQFKNIIVKFGRYVPNQKPHLDEVLGVELASDNQFAQYIN